MVAALILLGKDLVSHAVLSTHAPEGAAMHVCLSLPPRAFRRVPAHKYCLESLVAITGTWPALLNLLERRGRVILHL